MTAYFKELPWGFDFSKVHDRIKEISNDQTHHGTDASEFWHIPTERIVQEYPFSKIETLANAHGFSIVQAIYRRQFKDHFSIIHTDSFKLMPNADLVTVPFSLNIPLENTTSAITRWYDFSNNPTLKNEDTKFPRINHKKFTSPTPTHAENFLKYCVAEYTMNKPVIINTSITHNVDARTLDGSRTILSLWFIHVRTEELVTWEQSSFLENITID
jgi:hypothetical protein